MNKTGLRAILQYWHIQEFFLPQTLEAPSKINGRSKSIQAFRGTPQEIIDWIQRQRLTSTPNGYFWQFTLYGGIYPVEKIKEKLLEIFRAKDDVEERPQKGEAAAFAFGIDRELKIKTDGLQVSTAPWAMEKVRNGKIRLDYDIFKELVEVMQNDFSEALDGASLCENVLLELNHKILSSIGAEFLYDQNLFQVIAVQKRANNSGNDKDDLDMLNSFYIDDLKRTFEDVSAGKSRRLLEQYLVMEESGLSHRRIDIRKNIEHIYDTLSPEKMPDACWPTAGHYPLVFSQQFAINSILKRLCNDSGIYAVNGPPGTGKTTMLRDLIAMVVTERAKVIAQCKNHNELFADKWGKKIWKSNDYQRRYYPFKSALMGFEMVVASSNNGAVENVTLEIPTKKSVDEQWIADIDFFKEFGSELIEEAAWGNGAACLGNAKNKSSFISKFWYDQKNKKGEITFVGFQHYLKELQDLPEERLNKEWEKAKTRFNDALIEVGRIKKEKTAVKEKPARVHSEISKIQQEIAVATRKIEELAAVVVTREDTYRQMVEAYNTLQSNSDAIQKQLDALSADIESKTYALTQHKTKTDEHRGARPSFVELLLDLLFSFGKRSKLWNETLLRLEEEKSTLEDKVDTVQKDHERKSAEFLALKSSIVSAKNETVVIQKQIETLKQNIMTERGSLKSIENRLELKKREFDEAYRLRMNAEQRKETDGEREQTSPWMDKKFQSARAKVFIEALNLHRAFIHANAEKIRINLMCLMDVLSGSVKKDTEFLEAVRHVWATLFLCIPVVSTTFASFGRLFPHFWNQEIGWLLIDEAGQAPAQAAVGAIMRSKRCIVVGDPLQLEPIIGLPTSVQDILRKQTGAHENSLSQYTSVQKRADLSELHGTYLEDDDGGKIWVGSPLRVHRRCHSPMFEISNTTTYGGMMVHGKKGDECTLPPSQWIDVVSTSASGHWIEEEGQTAKKAVTALKKAGIGEKDIYLISPFRDVVNGLRNTFRGSNLIHKDQIGTIHTVQGKEAKVVILVLGSNPTSEGARAWAASKPNLLNVAATRAKDRLYIIGNKSKWKDKRYFKDAVNLLSSNRV